MSQRVRTLLLTLCLMCWGGMANAIILHYQGNNFTTTELNGPTTPSDQYTTSDSVSGWIELTAMLESNLDQETVTPLSFSFSDGVTTIDETTATGSLFFFSTDESGAITNWEVLVRSFPDITGGGLINDIVTSNVSDTDSIIGFGFVDFGAEILCGPTSSSSSCALSGDPYYSQSGTVRNAQGVWTYKAVPEPTTLALLSLGLAGLGFTRRRLKA